MKTLLLLTMLSGSLMISGCSSLKNLYLSEMNSDLNTYPPGSSGIFTEDDLADLPEQVQRYFVSCGYLGKEKMDNVQVHWEDAYLKMSPDKPWTKIDCYQYNSAAEPTRIVYMKSRILGLIPFEGRDTYRNGSGNMLIKLLKIFTVVDAKGKEMDESALVTVLSETLLLPSYALQDYVTWETVDERSARATLTYNGLSVSGIFHFNENNEMISFVTHDRNFSEKDGSYTRVKWSAYVDNYIEKNGIRFPSYVRAVWNRDEGDFEYFRGRITSLEYNIKN